MYLKSLEVYGFKSFANKIELLFGPGITGVVGPNGSGKSNIADAIRWVLGEQSARLLRGSKMEDVIFAGADGRRPLGFAEVSLTLDNSDQSLPVDFAEITITRKVFRSGESEYYINRVPCRLRDLVELFMDTGIGRESYSLVEQGKIDSVLSSRPEERRRLLEEAAGITKYRAKKEAASKKLQGNQQDLLRIRDIITEVERELGPLKEEAHRAQKYLQLEDDLTRMELNLYSRRFTILSYYEKACSETLKKLREESSDAVNKLASIEEEVYKKKNDLSRIEEDLTVFQESLRTIDSEISAIEKKTELARGKGDGVREQKGLLLKRKHDLESRLKAAHSKLLEGEETLEEFFSELLKVRSYLEEIETELVDVRSRFETAVEDVEKGKTDMIDLLNEIAEKRNVITRSEAEEGALLRELDRLRGEVLEKDEVIGEKRSELRTIRERIEKLQGEGSSYRETLNNVLAAKERLELDLATRQNKLDELKNDLNQVSSKLKVFLNLRENHEGYMRGVQAILSLAKKHPDFAGIIGAVAEVLKVEPRYQVAIESALGSRVQFIITESDKDVEIAIDYLKRTKKGRATFLPLTMIRPTYLSGNEKQVLRRRGILGLTSSFVSFDPKYEKVVMNLLGRVLLAETLNDAITVAKDFRSLRIVSLDGDLINPGGIITGGSFQERDDGGLLGRNLIIEELEREGTSLRRKVTELEEEIKVLKARDLNDLVIRAQEIQDYIREGHFSLGEAKKRDEEITSQLTDLLRRSEGLTLEISDREGVLKEVRERKESAKCALETLVNKKSALEKGVGAAQEGNTILEDKVRRLSSEAVEVRVKLAAMEEKVTAAENEVERCKSNCSTLKAELNSIESEMHALSEREVVLTKELSSWNDEKNNLVRSRIDTEEKVRSLKGEKSLLTAALYGIEKEMRILEVRINKLREEIHANEIVESRIFMEMKSIKERVYEEYNRSSEELINHDYIKEIEPNKDFRFMDISSIDDESLLLDIARVKGDMQRLEPVALGAIDSYKERKERYDFLTSQYEDLIQGRNKLFQVIQEIDKTIKKRFKETYEVVKVHFQQIFEKLFGGGKAELILEDENDILQTGLDIIAQPPGKKPQNLSLLSGGERALTAIAFIFALIEMRPPPFCVLDEIDASLDEVNVERFALLLKEFSSTLQFIVVTHRRPTMEVADVIYGVTMEQTGISKVLSAKFSEDVDELNFSNGNTE